MEEDGGVAGHARRLSQGLADGLSQRGRLPLVESADLREDDDLLLSLHHRARRDDAAGAQLRHPRAAAP